MKLSIIIIALIFSMTYVHAQDYNYYSPDGKLELIVNTDDGINWSIKYNGRR